MSDEHVTSAEFTRFRSDFTAFQDRLQRQIDGGFTGVHGRLDELNGRTRGNSEAIVGLGTRLTSLEKEEGEALAVVEGIRDHGCSQFENHSSVMRAMNGDERDDLDLTGHWSPRKKVAVGGGLVAVGGIGGAIVLELLRNAHAALQLLRSGIAK